MLTVRNAIEIVCRRKWKLVAGKSGIDRAIKTVTVLEVPDIVKWLNGGEFIVTSFYSLKDRIQDQCKIIRELNELNAAGIAIKTDENTTEIAIEIIEVANEINFPIFQIPNTTTYIDIMTPLNRKIFEVEQHNKLVEEFIKAAIFHTYKSRETMVIRGKTLGYDIERGAFFTISMQLDCWEKEATKEISDHFDLIAIKDNLYKYLDNILREYRQKKEIINYMIVRNMMDITLFIQAHDLVQAENHGKMILDLILKHHNLFYKDMRMTIGVGNIESGLEGIENGYNQAQYAIQLGRVIGKKQGCYFYKDLEIYSLVYNNSYETLNDVANSALGKIRKDSELLESIQTYFDCNENIMLASQSLFIHKNTLKYRLDRIKTITGLDVKNIDDKVKLYLGLIANNILTKTTKN